MAARDQIMCSTAQQLGDKLETFGVFAKLVDGGYVRFSFDDGKSPHRYVGWAAAQARWAELDDLRRAGKLPLVQYLAVRSDDDPDARWSKAPVGARNFFRPTTGRTYKTREHAARAFVKHHPDWEGREGGWLYRNGRAVVQGYWNLGSWLARVNLLLPVGNGRYAIFADAFPKEATS